MPTATNDTFSVSNIKSKVLTPVNITRENILVAYRGSIAHNLYVPPSEPNATDDTDLIIVSIGGIETYLGMSHFGSRGTKEHKIDCYDIVEYEIRKLFSMLEGGNPNVISLLWTRNSEFIKISELGKLILDNKQLFVSKLILTSFAGYANGQLKKMTSRDSHELLEYVGVTNELKLRGIHPNHRGQLIPPPSDHDTRFSSWKDVTLLEYYQKYTSKGENIGYMGEKRKSLVIKHGYDAKNAAHCIRLLKMAIEFGKTGEFTVYRTSDRDELLSIKHGKWKLEDVQKYADDLYKEYTKIKVSSVIPEIPDHTLIEKLLILIVKKYFNFN